MASWRVVEPADAGDAVGLEDVERGAELRHAGQMRAIGAGARDQLGMAVEQQRHVLVLRDRRKRLGDIDQRALVGFGQAQQHGGDVAGGQRLRPAAR